MIKIKFSKRLKDLREEKDITQKKLGKEIGVDQRSISFYEIGKYEPDLQTLIHIAQYFEVSTDYLLGLTDDPTPRTPSRNIRNNIEVNFGNVNMN